MLLSSSKSFIWSTISPWAHQSKDSRKFTTSRITKIKADYSDYPKTKKIIAQSAIAILGLGFVDAGYSGDWSRIGVISNETEDVLKIAAYGGFEGSQFGIASLLLKDDFNFSNDSVSVKPLPCVPPNDIPKIESMTITRVVDDDGGGRTRQPNACAPMSRLVSRVYIFVSWSMAMLAFYKVFRLVNLQAKMFR